MSAWLLVCHRVFSLVFGKGSQLRSLMKACLAHPHGHHAFRMSEVPVRGEATGSWRPRVNLSSGLLVPP